MPLNLSSNVSLSISCFVSFIRFYPVPLVSFPLLNLTKSLIPRGAQLYPEEHTASFLLYPQKTLKSAMNSHMDVEPERKQKEEEEE